MIYGLVVAIGIPVVIGAWLVYLHLTNQIGSFAVPPEYKKAA